MTSQGAKPFQGLKSLKSQVSRMSTVLDQIGFLPNKSGGWWYRQERNLDTIQIIPDDSVCSPNAFGKKTRKGWRLGIAQPGGMRWGKRVFDSQGEAVRHAFDYLHDNRMQFNLQRAVAEHKLSEQLQHNARLN